MAKKTELLDPIHPGEILSQEFLQPMGISINRLARDLYVPPNRISLIVNGERAITADTALRLGTYFGMSPELWLKLQADYDLRVTKRTRGEEIRRRVRTRRAA
jgi:addiction module HigA family antidote